MFGLPMEIVGPVLGIGAIIMFIVAGIVTLRVLTAKLPPPRLRAGDPSERAQLLEEVQVRFDELDHLKQRVGELEERVDFAERLLAERPNVPRVGPPTT